MSSDFAALPADRSVTFTITIDDYIKGGKLSYLSSLRRSHTWLFILLGVVSATLLCVSIAGDRNFPSSPSYWLIIPVGGLVGGPVFQYFYLLPASLRKAYRQHKALHRQIRFSWSDQGFESAGENHSGRLKWEDLVDTAENSASILLYTTSRLFHIIPKRYFTSAQIEDLRRCSSIVKSRSKQL